MIRRDKWWLRELERINREHREERAELIATIAHLAGQPLPDRGWGGDPEPLHQDRPRTLADPDQLP